MSFWKQVGKLAVDIGKKSFDELSEKTEEYKEYKREMQSESDSELAYIWDKNKTRNKSKATAAFQELKSRGYTPEEMKDMI